jgi:hypothetical protein
VDLGPAGDILWSRVIESPLQWLAGAVASDAQGNVVVGGTFGNSISFGAGASLAAPVINDCCAVSAFVAKFDANGAYQWSRAYGGTIVPSGGAQAHIEGIAIDPSGHIMLGGVFSGMIDFGTGPFTTSAAGIAATTMVFVAELDANGRIMGAETFPPEGDTETSVSALVLGPGGRLAIAGNYDTTVDFGGGPLPANGLSCSQYHGVPWCGDGFVAVFSR